MKKYIFPLLLFVFLFPFFLIAQINADIVGKTVTDELQVKTGATSGYILISDGVGNATWTNPATLPSGTPDWNTIINMPLGFSDGIDDVDDADNDPTNEYNTGFGLSGTILNLADNGGVFSANLVSLKDNLGNHTATTDLNMGNFSVQNANTYGFSSGALLQDDFAGGIQFLGSQFNMGCLPLIGLQNLQFCTGASIDDFGAGLTLTSPLGLFISSPFTDFGCSDIINLNRQNYCTGASLADDFAGGLLFTGSQFDMGCANLNNLTSLQLCNGGTIGDDGAGGMKFVSSTSAFDFSNGSLNAVGFVTYSSGAFMNGNMFLSPTGANWIDSPGSFSPEFVYGGIGGPLTAIGIGGPVNPAPPGSIALFGVPGIFPTFPNFLLGVWGDAYANDWWAYSDKSFKKNIKNISNATALVSRMNPVTYEMKKDSNEKRNFKEGYTFGFLAQELAEVLPEAVAVNSEGKHLVRYNAVIPVLAQSIKELNEKLDNGIGVNKVEALEQENTALRSEVEALKKENEAILKRLEKIESLLRSQ